MVSTSRRMAILAASIAVSLACVMPSAAYGGYLVFSKGSDIWVSKDDGSAAQPLVTAAQVGESRLRKPAVAPGSDAIAFESWNTDSTRVYDWEAGVVLKVGGGWATGTIWGGAGASSNDPDVTADRRVIFQSDAVVVTGGCDLFGCGTDGTASSGLVSVRFDGQDKRALPAQCESARDPAANPANAAQFAYVGCWVDLTPADPWDPIVYALRTVDGTTDKVVSYDDKVQLDTAWSPDGTQIVTSEEGTEPGIWLYPAAGSTTRLAVVPEPGATPFGSPRFMGNDRIVFAKNGDLWTVPAGCDHCAFPSQATQITHLGAVNDVAWTSAANFRTAAAAPAPTAPSPARDLTPPSIKAARLSKTTFTSGTKGVRFSFTLSEPAAAKLTLARRLTGRRRGNTCVKPTRKLRKARSCIRLVRVKSLSIHGTVGANAIPLTTRGLPAGRYTATLAVTDTAGNKARPVSRSFTIKRRPAARN